MNNEEKDAIQQFFNSIKKLKKLEIIRSDKYLGDIGEYISAHFYDIELADSGREPGHDGYDVDGRVQVKYHGSITRTNIDLGRPEEYDNLLIVLGPESLLRSSNFVEQFLVYRMSSKEVRTHENTKRGTYSCGKGPFNRQPDNVLNLRE